MVHGSWFTINGLILVHDSRLRVLVMVDTALTNKIKTLIENEGKSCSMDIGGITPLYVYRMWGGSVAIEDIVTAMEEVRRKCRLKIIWRLCKLLFSPQRQTQKSTDD